MSGNAELVMTVERPIRTAINWRPLFLSGAPIIAAFAASGLVLLMLGSDPLAYYAYVIQRGLLRVSGLQATLVHAIPMLMLGGALIVSFKAGLWNLGIDGQTLVGTMVAGIAGPQLVTLLPTMPALLLTLLLGALAGALWAVPVAALKAYRGINEVISGLMMSFLAASFCAAVIKLVAKDPASLEPQTYSIPVESRLPTFFGSNVNVGLVLAIVVLVGCHVMMTRTAFGLKLRILGMNAGAARHIGLGAPALTLSALCLSGALGGLAGATELIGVLGKMQASWNPAYGFSIVPLVFLARMNGYATMAFVFAFSVLHIGGASAATRLGVPQDFTLVLVGFLLLFLALAEFIDQRMRTRKA